VVSDIIVGHLFLAHSFINMPSNSGGDARKNQTFQILLQTSINSP